MPRERSISQLSCPMIHLFLALALEEKKINKICLKNGLLGRSQMTKESAFDLVHQQCHKEGSVVERSLSAYFNALYANEICTVSDIDSSSEKIQDLINSMAKTSPLEAILWALLTDGREAVRNCGALWGVGLLLRKTTVFQNQKSLSASLTKDKERLEGDLICEKNKNQTFKKEIKQLKLERKQFLETEVLIKKENKTLSDQLEKMTKESIAYGKLQRKLRILEYEVEALKQENYQYKLANIEKEISHYREEETGPIVPNLANKVSGDVAENSIPNKGCCFVGATALNTCSESPLCSRKIAIIGGMERLKTHYRAVIEELGGIFLFHNGSRKNGGSSIKNVIYGSDTVIFITSVNSHSALGVVKSICNKCNKEFKVMHRASVAALKRTVASL